jgi:hypothetical protein
VGHQLLARNVGSRAIGKEGGRVKESEKHPAGRPRELVAEGVA